MAPLSSHSDLKKVIKSARAKTSKSTVISSRSNTCTKARNIKLVTLKICKLFKYKYPFSQAVTAASPTEYVHYVKKLPDMDAASPCIFAPVAFDHLKLCACATSDQCQGPVPFDQTQKCLLAWNNHSIFHMTIL